MQFGPPKILACPDCGTPIRVWSLLSGNTCGAVLWSDGKLQAPGLPNAPQITRCSRCSVFFWVSKAQEFTGKESRWTFWKKPEAVRVLAAAEYLEALESGVASMREEEFYLRIHAWHGWNDSFRCMPDSSSAVCVNSRHTANLQALSALLSLDDPNHLLMKAEIARELGNMAEAVRLLSHPLPPPFADQAEQMRSWVEAGETWVKRFRDTMPSQAERELQSLLQSAERKEREKARMEEAKIVKARAVERGIATPRNSNEVIYAMDAHTFRELASDFPALSRIYFHPDKKKRHNGRPRLTILKAPNMNPFNVIVFIILVAAVVIFALARCNAGHSNEGRLQHDAHPVAAPVKQTGRGEFR